MGDAIGLDRVNIATGALTPVTTRTYTTWGTPTRSGLDLGFRYLYVGAADVQWDNAFSLGLAYMHARHYSPSLGRFLQPDPARADASTYRYAGNNPVTMADPSGRLFWFVIGVIAVSAVIDTGFYLATTPAQERNWQGWATTVAIGQLFTLVPVAKVMRWAGRVTKLLIRPRGLITKIDPNKLRHIFGNPDHHLGPLVQRFGSRRPSSGQLRCGSVARHALPSWQWGAGVLRSGGGPFGVCSGQCDEWSLPRWIILDSMTHSHE